MENILWGTPGISVFDSYSLHHLVWFFAITVLLSNFIKNKVWLAIIIIAFSWELFESWAWIHAQWMPFIGKENWINRAVGDTISDFVGYGLAEIIIISIKKQELKNYERQKK